PRELVSSPPPVPPRPFPAPPPPFPPPPQQPPQRPNRGPSRTRGVLAALGALAAAAALAAVGITQIASQSGANFPARPVATTSDGNASASGSVNADAIGAKVDPAVVDIHTT